MCRSSRHDNAGGELAAQQRRPTFWHPHPAANTIPTDGIHPSTRLAATSNGGGTSVAARRGKGDHEAGAVPHTLALRPDAPTVGLDDRTSDRQPDAAPAGTGGVGARGVDPVEALEHPLQQLGRDAVAGVADRKLDVAATAAAGDPDLPAAWGVAQRVAQQVRQDLADAVGIGQYLWQVGVDPLAQ